MAPELQASMKEGRVPSALSTEHYVQVARQLPRRQDLQKRVIAKAEQEELTNREVTEVAKAVREAADDEEVKTILSQPIGRTAGELTRAAKVEKLVSEPTVEPPPREKRRELAGRLLGLYMDLQQQVHVITQLREREQEQLDVLNPSQRQELLQVVRDLKAELQWLEDSLGGIVEGQAIVEGKTIEGR